MPSSKIANITIAGDITIPVTFWETNVPGIIVTSTPYSEPELGYRVTQAVSGLAITMTVFPSIGIAMVFAERIKGLIQYTEPQNDKDLNVFRAKIQNIVKEFMGQLDINPRSILERAIQLNGEES